MKIIFKTIFGSHLYGTNTPSSDHDYKGVFIEKIDDIILRKDKEVIHENTRKDKTMGVRNSPDDVDTEYKELRRFLKDCMAGQTYALDMLFAPSCEWLSWDDGWIELVFNRDKLLSKNVEPYIGYCRQQAGKYGLKGSRLGELLRVIDYLTAHDPKKPLYSVVDGIITTEYVTRIKSLHERPFGETPIPEEFLEVLGKKFQLNRQIGEILVSLKKMNEMYGERARSAQKNEGIDWKAISHACRCCYQLIELALTGEIKFPLWSAQLLINIKKGLVSYSIVQEELPRLMEQAIEDVKNSKFLPDEPDYKFWDQFILDMYHRNG